MCARSSGCEPKPVFASRTQYTKRKLDECGPLRFPVSCSPPHCCQVFSSWPAQRRKAVQHQRPQPQSTARTILHSATAPACFLSPPAFTYTHLDRGQMGQAFSSVFTGLLDRLFGARELRVVMLGLDAAGEGATRSVT